MIHVDVKSVKADRWIRILYDSYFMGNSVMIINMDRARPQPGAGRRFKRSTIKR